MRTNRMVEAGEEVRVFDVNGSRVGQPEGGWPGKVVKAGPKLVTISYAGAGTVFRRDTGRTNDNYEHQWYLTLEEADDTARRATAKDALYLAGIEVTMRCSLTTAQLEAMVQAIGIEAP